MTYPNKFIALIAILFPLSLMAQSKLTSLSPAIYYTESAEARHVITVRGENLWPSYMSQPQASERVKLFFSAAGKTMELEKTAIGTDKILSGFNSSDWLYKTGSIEVYVTIDGTRTNSLWLQVNPSPTVAPVLKEVYPSKLKTGQEGEYYYAIRLSADNLDGESFNYVTIGDQPAYIISTTADRTALNVWVPKAYINSPGTYNITIRTSYGTSNALPLVLEKPALRMTKINSPVAATPIGTKPVSSSAPVSPTLNVTPISGTVNPSSDSPADLLVSGLKITLYGNISFGEDGAALETYVRSLDKVILVDNLLHISNNNRNLLVEIKSNKLPASDAENAKKLIEARLSAMNLTYGVVVIK